jgi:hypothetical protein
MATIITDHMMNNRRDPCHPVSACGAWPYIQSTRPDTLCRPRPAVRSASLPSTTRRSCFRTASSAVLLCIVSPPWLTTPRSPNLDARIQPDAEACNGLSERPGAGWAAFRQPVLPSRLLLFYFMLECCTILMRAEGVTTAERNSIWRDDGGEAVIQALQHEGVEVVFGLPGVQIRDLRRLLCTVGYPHHDCTA